MKSYYGEKTSFFSRVIAGVVIIVSFIFMIKLFPQKVSYTSAYDLKDVSYYKGSWILAFGLMISGLVLSSIILLLEAILHNVAKER